MLLSCNWVSRNLLVTFANSALQFPEGTIVAVIDARAAFRLELNLFGDLGPGTLLKESYEQSEGLG